MTHSDVIRAMTDEELAELFFHVMSERDRRILDKLSELGIDADLVEIPAASISAITAYLQEDADS